MGTFDTPAPPVVGGFWLLGSHQVTSVGKIHMDIDTPSPPVVGGYWLLASHQGTSVGKMHMDIDTPSPPCGWGILAIGFSSSNKCWENTHGHLLPSLQQWHGLSLQQIGVGKVYSQRKTLQNLLMPDSFEKHPCTTILDGVSCARSNMVWTPTFRVYSPESLVPKLT